MIDQFENLSNEVENVDTLVENESSEKQETSVVVEDTDSTDEDDKEKRKRTVSTSKLERLRLQENLSVVEFIENLLSYEVDNPSESLQDSLNKFDEHLSEKTKSTSNRTSKEPDWNRITVEQMVERGLYMPSGNILKIQKSRKYDNENILAVSIEQGPGTKANTICDLSDLSNVRIEFQGITLKTIDLSQIDYITTRENNTNGVNESNVKNNDSYEEDEDLYDNYEDNENTGVLASEIDVEDEELF